MEPNVATKKRTRRRASTPSTRAADSPATVKLINEPIGQLPQFPPGIRFCPHDLELIEHYLMRKIRGEELPCDIVKSVDLYKFHPETLIKNYKCIRETAWYFFTQRLYKYAKVVCRSTNRGFWKVTGSNMPIWNKKEEAVGEKRHLTYFEGKQPSGTKTNWRMHEYTILEDHQTINQQKLYESWVLCKVYNKDNAKSMSLCVAADKSDVELPKGNIWEPDMPSKSQAEVAFSLREQSNNDQQYFQVTDHPTVPKQSTLVPRKYQINGGFPTAPNQHGTVNGGTSLPAPILNSQPRNFLPVLPQAYELPSYRKSLGGVRQYHYHYVLCNCLQGSVISQKSTHGSGSQMVNEVRSSNQSYMGQHVESYPKSESTTEPTGVIVYGSHMVAQPHSINNSDQGSLNGGIGGGSSDLSEEYCWQPRSINNSDQGSLNGGIGGGSSDLSEEYCWQDIL